MKRFLVAIVVVAFFALLWFQTPGSGSHTFPTSTPTITSTPIAHVPKEYEDITWKEATYRIAWFAVPDPERILLIPNYTEKRTGQAVRDSNDCTYMTSGGFYTEKNTPLGLVTVGENVIGKYKNSSLFQGFFLVNENGTAIIDTDIPQVKTRFALQSGPILLIDGSPRLLRLKSDELARRIFVATTQDGSVVFGAVYDPEATFGGPFLADLPRILEDFKKKANLDLDMALNLDGGSASAFSSEGIFLQELSTVGSFFCIK